MQGGVIPPWCMLCGFGRGFVEGLLTLTVPSCVNPIDSLHIFMPKVMRGLTGLIQFTFEAENMILGVKSSVIVILNRRRHARVLRN